MPFGLFSNRNQQNVPPMQQPFASPFMGRMQNYQYAPQNQFQQPRSMFGSMRNQPMPQQPFPQQPFPQQPFQNQQQQANLMRHQQPFPQHFPQPGQFQQQNPQHPNPQHPNAQQPQQFLQQQKKPQDPRVTFEPLEEDVAKQFGINQEEKPPSETKPQAKPQLPANFEKNLPPSPLKTIHAMNNSQQLGQIVQNERNSAVFYQGLAEMAETSAEKAFFMDMMHRCDKRRQTANAAYKNQVGHEYTVQENPIQTKSVFRDGIILAVHEESRAIEEIAELYETEDNSQICKTLNSLLYKKTSDLGRLLSLLYTA